MKNDNEIILERLRGIPMQKGTWLDKFDPQYPYRPNANAKAIAYLEKHHG